MSYLATSLRRLTERFNECAYKAINALNTLTFNAFCYEGKVLDCLNRHK